MSDRRSRSLCDLCKGVKSLGKERSARGEEPLFKAVCSSRVFFIKRVSCSARPASRRWTATRTQSLTREKCVRIFPYKDFSLNICCEITPPLRHHPDILFRAVQAEHHLRSAFRPFFLLSHEPSEVLNRISKHFQSVPVEEYAY